MKAFIQNKLTQKIALLFALAAALVLMPNGSAAQGTTCQMQCKAADQMCKNGCGNNVSCLEQCAEEYLECLQQCTG